MQIFYFFRMSTRYSYLEDDASWLNVFRGPRIFGLYLILSEDQRFWILTHVFKDPEFLDLGSCFQRTKVFVSKFMSLEDPGFSELGTSFQRTKGFLGFGSCFQNTKGSGSWLLFSETKDFWILAHVFRGPKVFWALALVSKGPNFLDPSLCYQKT